jgi:hypothetical protein
MPKVHQESPSQSMLTLTLESQVRLKRQRVALARRDVIRDVDVKRRGSGATVDARAMNCHSIIWIIWVIALEDTGCWSCQ